VKAKPRSRKHFGDVPEAQFVAQLPQDSEQDDISGN
jgi:hypothetical protein